MNKKNEDLIETIQALLTGAVEGAREAMLQCVAYEKATNLCARVSSVMIMIHYTALSNDDLQCAIDASHALKTEPTWLTKDFQEASALVSKATDFGQEIATDMMREIHSLEKPRTKRGIKHAN